MYVCFLWSMHMFCTEKSENIRSFCHILYQLISCSVLHWVISHMTIINLPYIWPTIKNCIQLIPLCRELLYGSSTIWPGFSDLLYQCQPYVSRNGVGWHRCQCCSPWNSIGWWSLVDQAHYQVYLLFEHHSCSWLYLHCSAFGVEIKIWQQRHLLFLSWGSVHHMQAEAMNFIIMAGWSAVWTRTIWQWFSECQIQTLPWSCCTFMYQPDILFYVSVYIVSETQ
jgi:hypothetical protein